MKKICKSLASVIKLKFDLELISFVIKICDNFIVEAIKKIIFTAQIIENKLFRNEIPNYLAHTLTICILYARS